MNQTLDILLKGRNGYTKDLSQTEITVLHVITSHYLIYYVTRVAFNGKKLETRQVAIK